MQNDMRDRLIEIIRKSHCVDVWDYWNDELKQPNPIETLADHLIKNGVVVPPCKLGDKIYQTDGIRIYESTISEITFTAQKMICVTENIAFDETAIGKSIFLDKKEVQAKLKGGEGR